MPCNAHVMPCHTLCCPVLPCLAMPAVVLQAAMMYNWPQHDVQVCGRPAAALLGSGWKLVRVVSRSGFRSPARWQWGLLGRPGVRLGLETIRGRTVASEVWGGMGRDGAGCEVLSTI